jgi:hypothetical protein
MFNHVLNIFYQIQIFTQESILASNLGKTWQLVGSCTFLQDDIKKKFKHVIKKKFN